MYNNVYYIDGVPLYDITINLPRFSYETECFSRQRRATYYDKNDVSMMCRIPLHDYNTSKIAYKWATSPCVNHIGVLGKGYLCKHCGDYNPSGSLMCLKCGGEAIERWIRPSEFSFFISEYFQEPTVYREELRYIDVELVILDWNETTLETLAGLDVPSNSFCTNGYSLNTGLYLCKYCGQAVYEGETCPGCGGKRIPFQELVQVERTCIYCGKEVLGSIICPGCGARIKGLTFQKVFVN